MVRKRLGEWGRCNRVAAQTILAATIAALHAQTAFALITGGEGNEPVGDPGWQAGAATVFNSPTRVAYWVGPPFGGGQWHSDCRGDAAALSAVLADFARIDAKIKRVEVRDGVGRSFWLNANDAADKRDAAQIDWVVMIWQPSSWERLRNMPAGLKPSDVAQATDDGPPAQIDVYVGGGVNWSEVIVPTGLEVVDNRLEAHGFKLSDGLVIEGTLRDLATKQALAGRVEVQRIEPQAEGGYRYTTIAERSAAADGHWVLKNVSGDWQRVVATADGFVPRVIGYVRDDQPGWHQYTSNLARPAAVSGRVTDDASKPLPGVDVVLHDVTSGELEKYESPDEYRAVSDADGKFEFTMVPIGAARIWLSKSGYCRPGLGPEVKTPAEDIGLNMQRSAAVTITVDFSGVTRPAEFVVEMTPEGGNKVGTWGGSSIVNANNQVSFKDVPPGRYVVSGRPNPSREGENSNVVTLDLQGGATASIKLSAKPRDAADQ